MPARLEKYEEYEIYEPEVPQPPKKKPRPKVELDAELRSRCKFLVAAFAVLAMLVTFRYGLSASRGYDLVHTQQQVDTLEQENEQLKIEIARLKSPQRIKDIATNSLGMEVPQQVYFAHGGLTTTAPTGEDAIPNGQ